MTNSTGPRRPDVVEIELVGGVERRQLAVVAYDEGWREVFLDHQGRVRTALGTAAVAIEHIGSTSVPGLAAKPIIDIVVAVHDITAEEDYLVPLLAAGYELRTREPGHRLVRTAARDVHVHIMQVGDPAIDRYLLFRDRLRAHDGDRSLYADTKRALLERGFNDMNAYSDAKTEVIAAILARAVAASTIPYASTINGRTAQALPEDEFETKIPLVLGNLNGESFFAYSLWRQPENVEWGDRLPKNWPHEYLQSAGTADGMSIEIRRLEGDEYRQYTIGRGGERFTAQDQVIAWGPNRRELTLSTDEVFTADEAAPIYLAYYRIGTIPDGYSLRLLDLTYPPANEESAANDLAEGSAE